MVETQPIYYRPQTSPRDTDFTNGSQSAPSGHRNCSSSNGQTPTENNSNFHGHEIQRPLYFMAYADFQRRMVAKSGEALAKTEAVENGNKKAGGYPAIATQEMT